MILGKRIEKIFETPQIIGFANSIIGNVRFRIKNGYEEAIFLSKPVEKVGEFLIKQEDDFVQRNGSASTDKDSEIFAVKLPNFFNGVMHLA